MSTILKIKLKKKRNTYFLSDCGADQTLPVYVNISDNATFHIQTNESQSIHTIEVLRSFSSIRRRIFLLHSLDWRRILRLPFDGQYQDRVLSVTVNVTAGLRILYLTIADIQPDDNGTYIIQTRRGNETCFIVYVLGKK